MITRYSCVAEGRIRRARHRRTDAHETRIPEIRLRLPSAGLPAVSAPAAGHGQRSPLLDRLGVGLFTIPTMVEKDFAGTMKVLASIGYKEIETFGPYWWSAPAAQARWKVTSQSLAFKGSGYFGLTPAAVRLILDDLGLRSPSMHTDLGLAPDAARADERGGARMGSATSCCHRFRRTNGRTSMATGAWRIRSTRFGAQAAKLGVRFRYHNHGYGLKPVDGAVPFELLVDQTDPALVDLQMDLYWVTAGGVDPVAYLPRPQPRYKSLHVKDMAKPVRFAGDGGDSSQWIALFPFIADAGSWCARPAGNPGHSPAVRSRAFLRRARPDTDAGSRLPTSKQLQDTVSNRYHVKDWRSRCSSPATGGDSSQWIAQLPVADAEARCARPAGNSVRGEAAGVEHSSSSVTRHRRRTRRSKQLPYFRRYPPRAERRLCRLGGWLVLVQALLPW